MKKATTPIAMSARFFAMMLAMFLARVRPASTKANPACIRNTRQPAITSHRLSRIACVAPSPSNTEVASSWAHAGLAHSSVTRPMVPPTSARFLYSVRIGLFPS